MAEINALYEAYRLAYEAWAAVERPEAAKNWQPLSLFGTPEQFEKLGNFRSAQWAEYVKARDAYFSAVKGCK